MNEIMLWGENSSFSKRILLCCLLMGMLMFTSRTVLAKPLQVVTTFSILEDFIEQIGGNRVEVHSLIPKGADPHSWEPSPREARLVAQADLVVVNGAGFDDWMISLVKNTAKPHVQVVFATEGLSVLAHVHDHHHHDHDHGHSGDPHLWLSVPNAIAYVETITGALVDLSPQDAGYFAARSADYIQRLRQLDQNMLHELGQITEQNRVIVAYHNAFSYLAERYGFHVVEFLVENPEAEPNPRDLARLVALLSKQDKPVVFTEPQLTSGSRYVQTLAREVGASIYILYSDSLSLDVPTYVEMMEYNMRTLVEALQ